MIQQRHRPRPFAFRCQGIGQHGGGLAVHRITLHICLDHTPSICRGVLYPDQTYDQHPSASDFGRSLIGRARSRPVTRCQFRVAQDRKRIGRTGKPVREIPRLRHTRRRVSTSNRHPYEIARLDPASVVRTICIYSRKYHHAALRYRRQIEEFGGRIPVAQRFVGPPDQSAQIRRSAVPRSSLRKPRNQFLLPATARQRVSQQIPNPPVIRLPPTINPIQSPHRTRIVLLLQIDDGR